MVSRQLMSASRSSSHWESEKSSVPISQVAAVFRAPGTSESSIRRQLASSGSTIQSSSATMAAKVRYAASRHTPRRDFTAAGFCEPGK